MSAKGAIADSSAQQKAAFAMLVKKDPHIIRLVDSAGHVALYEFDEAKQSWARGKVEGALHIIERDEDPRYQLVVVNRLSPENRVEDICPELQLQNNDPYLFYKNKRGETHGIWFYNSQERERIVSFIENLDEKDMTVRKPADEVAAPTDSEGDIMRFFNKSGSSGAPLSSSSSGLPHPHAPYLGAPVPKPGAAGFVPLPPPLAGTAGPAPIPMPFSLPRAPGPLHPGMVPQPPHAGNGMPYPQMRPYPDPHSSAALPSPSPYPPSSHVPVTLPASLPIKVENQPAASGAHRAAAPKARHGAPLTKQQLKDALLRLSQDDEFIDLLYAQYAGLAP